MFIDEIKVHGRAGHAGKGAIAFHREAFVPKGGPSGGNGGRGGEVILEGDRDINNLIGLYYQPRLHAENGKQGMGKGMDGAAGKDLIVKVPCGTLVWRVDGPFAPEPKPRVDEDEDQPASLPVSTRGRPLLRRAGGAQAWEVNLEEEERPTAPGGVPKGELLADITQHGQRFVLCKGGRGGLGNRNFAAISRARPKIAPYPFTTLHPQIGIVEYEDYFRLTVCDVPGLIEGAHNNVGLGHSFLRHIQRCKILVILLDMAGTDGREPWDDYKHLLEELELYDPSLVKRPRLIVANKMDEPVAEKNLKQFKRKIRKTKVLPISAGLGEGIEEFRKQIRETVEATVSV